MGGSVKVLAAVAAASGVAGVPAGAVGAAAPYRESDFNFAVFSGRSPITGVVVARQGPGTARGPITVSVSLHRMRAGVTYRIVGSRRTCAQQLTGDANRDWFLDVRAARGKTDALRVVRRTTGARLRTIRSVRISQIVGDIHQPLKCDGNEVAVESLE